MRKISCIFALFCVFAVCFVPQSGFSYVKKDIARVRVMDKIAGKTQVVKLPVGQNVQIDGLTMVVRDCEQSDPYDAENYFVFIEIYKKNTNRIFSGWMNHNEPGQNPLQDDTYDVWLEKCE